MECLHDDESLRAMVLELRRRYEPCKVQGKPLKFLFRPPPGGIVGEFAIRDSCALVVVYHSPSSVRTSFQLFCTFTHELGHWCSWRDGTRTSEYEAAHSAYGAAVRDSDGSEEVMPAVPEATRLIIFEEEVRAWTHGYLLAQEVGFIDAPAYETEALRGLAIYRQQLHISLEMRPITRICQ